MTAQKMVHIDIDENISWSNIALNNPKDIVVLSKLLMVAVMQLTNMPIFMESRGELDAISVKELCRIQKKEDLDTTIEIQYDFFSRCLVLMNSLTLFGWKRMKDLRFSKEDSQGVGHDGYYDTHLRVYSDYFDELVDREHISGSIHTDVYTFFNERLGKYLKYTEEHAVDEQLRAEIVNELSHIIALFGVSRCVNSVRDYGYEIVYIHSYDAEDECYRDYCFSEVNFLMPVHACNLEKLLDRAYELYPIES